MNLCPLIPTHCVSSTWRKWLTQNLCSFPSLPMWGWHRNAKWPAIRLVEGKKLKQRICKIRKLSHQPLGKLFHHDGDWVWASACPKEPTFSVYPSPSLFWGLSVGERAPGRKQQPISMELHICQMPPTQLIFPESNHGPQTRSSASCVSSSVLCP